MQIRFAQQSDMRVLMQHDRHIAPDALEKKISQKEEGLSEVPVNTKAAASCSGFLYCKFR